MFAYCIIGAGLAGLLAACRLVEADKGSVAIVSDGYGGTPYIAAFNAVLPDNPSGDSVERYTQDMLHAGYDLCDRALIGRTAALTGEAVALLERWGVRFSRKPDGSYLLRRASGSSVPRSLCRDDMLVGEHIVETLVPALRARGVRFFDSCACVGLCVRDGRAAGVTALDRATGKTFDVLSPRVLAAWGGVGRLYAESTYPADVDGRGLAMAFDAGAALMDLEFVEFEPMVTCEPAAAKGEPCPTAMLGEGAFLLNRLGERFLLKVRPQGEAGAPKSLINEAIQREVKAGRGSPLGGCYVDLRMIPQETLEAYPWFYFRLKKAGLDVKKELLQVGPMAHSHSGGIAIGLNGMSSLPGLFAAGEAAAGMHGACRMAGNAAAQAAASGLLAADGMLGYEGTPVAAECAPCADAASPSACAVSFRADDPARAECGARVGRILMEYVNRDRTAKGLSEAINELNDLLPLAARDTLAWQSVRSALLIAQAALAREETRGTHIRADFPTTSPAFECSLCVLPDGAGARIARVERK